MSIRQAAPPACNWSVSLPAALRACLQVDVYALGVILNECYTRRQPWRDSSHLFQVILRVSMRRHMPVHTLHAAGVLLTHKTPPAGSHQPRAAMGGSRLPRASPAADHQVLEPRPTRPAQASAAVVHAHAYPEHAAR